MNNSLPVIEIDESNLQDFFSKKIPLIDVRSPIEFRRGAIPGAVNLPLMVDTEREKVGIKYKDNGQEEAIKLGHELVDGQAKAERVFAWTDFCQKHPDACLYCFRGGLRSKIAQTWIFDAGFTIPRIAGGYKRLRTLMREDLPRTVEKFEFIMVDGLTGTGKTEVIRKVKNSLDLEKYGNHKGSAFGDEWTPQPSQIDFEHTIVNAFWDLERAGYLKAAVEYESAKIGRLNLPLSIISKIKASPIVVIEDEFENRVGRIYRDYVFLAYQGKIEQGFQADVAHAETRLRVFGGFEKLLKVFPGFAFIKQLCDKAFSDEITEIPTEAHQAWISELLNQHYDPLYKKFLKSKNSRVIFTGKPDAVEEFLSKSV